MIDGGRPVVVLSGMPVLLYEALKDWAQQFADGGMTIDTFVDGIERMAADATALLPPHSAPPC